MRSIIRRPVSTPPAAARRKVDYDGDDGYHNLERIPRAAVDVNNNTIPEECRREEEETEYRYYQRVEDAHEPIGEEPDHENDHTWYGKGE